MQKTGDGKIEKPLIGPQQSAGERSEPERSGGTMSGAPRLEVLRRAKTREPHRGDRRRPFASRRRSNSASCSPFPCAGRSHCHRATYPFQLPSGPRFEIASRRASLFLIARLTEAVSVKEIRLWISVRQVRDRFGCRRQISNTLRTSSPKWLMTLTAILPDAGLSKGQLVVR